MEQNSALAMGKFPMDPLIERLNSLEKKLSQMVEYIKRAKRERNEAFCKVEELTALLRNKEQALKELTQTKERELKLRENLKRFEEEREKIKSKIKTILREISELEKKQGI